MRPSPHSRFWLLPLRKRSFLLAMRTLVSLAILGVGPGLSAQRYLETIPLPCPAPVAMAMNPVNHTIYILDSDSDNLTRIKVPSGKPDQIQAGIRPVAVAVNPVNGKVYVSNHDSANVFVLDGDQGSFIATGDHPGAMAINSVTNVIYVVVDGGLAVIDGATGDSSLIPMGHAPTAVAVNQVTNQVFVADASSLHVSVIDANNNNMITDVQLPDNFGKGIGRMAASPLADVLYLTDISGNFLYIMGCHQTNGGTPLIFGMDPMGGYGFDFLTVNPAVGAPISASLNNGMVYYLSIESHNNQVGGIYYWPIDLQSTPADLAVNPSTGRIYVATRANLTSFNFDARDVQTWATPGLVAVTVDPITDRIYALCPGSGLTVFDGADFHPMMKLRTGRGPLSIVVNPVTGRVYTPISGDDSVMVFDLTSGTSSKSLQAGRRPQRTGLNLLTNQVYITNYGTGSTPGTVTVVDGATDLTSSIPVGVAPVALAINPITNRAYVPNSGSDSVSVIDGTAGTVTNVATGEVPLDAAVNPVTNKVYVPNANGNSITVIDGATNTTSLISGVEHPSAVAVNSITNQIYVTNKQVPGSVTRIDGATGATTLIPTVDSPRIIAIDPVSDKIYVGGLSSAHVTEIDGPTLSSTDLDMGKPPFALTVDPSSGRVYCSTTESTALPIIEGSTLAVTSLGIDAIDCFLAQDPVSGLLYVSEPNDDFIEILDPDNRAHPPFQVSVSGNKDNDTVGNPNIFCTTNPRPTFSATATSKFGSSVAQRALPDVTGIFPVEPVPFRLFYAVDPGMATTWTSVAPDAPGSNPAQFSLPMTEDLSMGIHRLETYAMSTASGSIPLLSDHSVFMFAILPVRTWLTGLTVHQDPPVTAGPVSVTLGAALGVDHLQGNEYPSGTLTFLDGTTRLGSQNLSDGCATLTVSVPAGLHTFSAIYSGDARYACSAPQSWTGTIHGLATVTLGDLNQTYTGLPLSPAVATQPAGLTVSLSYSQNDSPVAAPVAAGSYTVAATVVDPAFAGSATGTLVIAQAPATVTLSGLNATYTGSPLAAVATTIPAGLPVTLAYAQNGSPVASPLAAGTYGVTATVASANFAGSATGTLVIAKAPATLTLGELKQTYTGSPLTPAVTTVPAGLAVAFAYAQNGTAVDAPTAMGNYDVTATILDPNFVGSTTGTLVITAPVITLSPSAPSLSVGPQGSASGTLVLGATGHPLQAVDLSVSGLPAGATLTFSQTHLEPSQFPATLTFQVRTSAGFQILGSLGPAPAKDWPWGPGSVLVCGILALPFRRRKGTSRRTGLVALGLATILLGAMAACGGSHGNASRLTSATAPGSYVVTITASSNGVVQATTSFTLNVTR